MNATAQIVVFDKARSVDPTGTSKLRMQWRGMTDIRLRQFRFGLRTLVVERDALGLGMSSDQPVMYTGHAQRMMAFGAAVSELANNMFLNGWLGNYVGIAWQQGWSVAVNEVGGHFTSSLRMGDADLQIVSANNEFNGIVAAAVQAALRTANSVHGHNKAKAFLLIVNEFEKIARRRMWQAVDFCTVQTFNRAKIMVYRHAGVQGVGVLPEVKAHTHDDGNIARDKLHMHDAPRNLVGVRTAGDDRVCAQCEDFAADAPYSLAEAERALPLHPHCRCSVYPWHDRRFRRDAFFDRDFDPSKHPRALGGEHGGEFSTGVYGFVSPNVSNLSFTEAKKELDSAAQHTLRQAATDVDWRLGLRGEAHSAVGAWSDGAENSLMIEMTGGNFEAAKVAMAMKGALADQKAVLVFEPNENGDAYLASYDTQQSLDDTHAALLQAGVSFHTLEPIATGTRVHVFGSDQETLDKTAAEAGRHGAKVEVIAGRGEFVGTTKEDGTDREQRDDAQRQYQAVIQQAAATGQLHGHDVKQVWQTLRHRWPTLAAKTLAVDAASLRTLYVRRDVLNAAEIIAWAKSVGFATTLQADDMHITVCYSKALVDWSQLSPLQDTMEIYTKFSLEWFGDDNDVAVLSFNDPALDLRHQEFRKAGASWDWPTYTPHITISWHADARIAPPPYAGKITLGPEIFKQVKAKWSLSVSEDAAFDPVLHPRDPQGRWADIPDTAPLRGKPVFTVHHSLGVNQEHIFEVRKGETYVGEARLSHTGEYVVDLGIKEGFRRQGLASALYNHIEHALGHKLKPSPVYQTAMGSAFWQSRKPDADETTNSSAVHLLDMYRDRDATAEGIISEFKNAEEKIKQVEHKLAIGVETNKMVSEGGFMQSDGTYTSAREALHMRIMQHYLNPAAVKAATPAKDTKPTYAVFGGRCGSGKSWLTSKDGPVDKTKAIYLNGDDIKEMLPEYAGWNAALLHEEASDIETQIDSICRNLGLNVIRDGTMRTSASTARRVQEYKNAGYRIEGYYMFVPPQLSARRALGRFLEIGRYVPISSTLGTVSNEHTFDAMKTQFDKWAMYQNMGKVPTMVAHG